MRKTVRATTLLLAVLYLLSVSLPATATGNNPYLRPNKEIVFKEGDHVQLLASELTAGKFTTEEKAMAIYSYIVTGFDYDWELYGQIVSKQITHYTPDANSVLKKQKGICYDIASLYAAMCRNIGIPTKMIKGYARNVRGYHAWNSVYDDTTDKWVSIDLTTDLCLKKGAASSWRPMRHEAVARSIV